MPPIRPLAALAACVALALPAAQADAARATQTVRAQPALEAALVQQMNAVRRAHGRAPLRPLATLARPARAHSAFLARSGSFQHEAADGAPFWTRLVAAGFPRQRRMAENIALVQGCTPAAMRQVVRLWMDSPGHRANLLDRRLRATGAGVVATPGCAEILVTADYGG
jgi:uncharacterized protein YkwD